VKKTAQVRRPRTARRAFMSDKGTFVEKQAVVHNHTL
jgi:hypothetical protein